MGIPQKYFYTKILSSWKLLYYTCIAACLSDHYNSITETAVPSFRSFHLRYLRITAIQMIANHSVNLILI